MLTVIGGRKMNYCSTLDMFSSNSDLSSSSSGKKKKSAKSHKPTLQGTWGIPSNEKSEAGLGSHAYMQSLEFNAIMYVKEVKNAFKDNPCKYLEFKELMFAVKQQGSNTVDIVNQVVDLLGSRTDLIKGFGFFLPPNIKMIVEDNAVVINVQPDDENSKEYTYGPAASLDTETVHEYTEEPDEPNEDPLVMQYLRNARWTFMYQPDVYEQLITLIKGLQKAQLSVFFTVNQVVKMLKDHTDLVLGFNVFLREGFKIIEDKKHMFLLQRPCQSSKKHHLTPLGV